MDWYSEDFSKYSISFGDTGRATLDDMTSWVNTWRDWHMVPTSRPVINPPKARTNYVNVPARDGALDYSEAIDGIHFDMYTGTWEFVVLHDFNLENNMSWADVYSDILMTLHGRERQVVLSDEPEVTYTGRLFIESWKSEEHYSKVTIKYELDPWKTGVNDTSWLRYAVWFEFPSPIISRYSDKYVNRYGFYLKFSNPNANVEKAAAVLDLSTTPFVYRSAGVKGTNVTKCTYVPFVSYGDNIVADGLSNSNINTFNLGTKVTGNDKSYYWIGRMIGADLQAQDGHYLSEFRVGSGSDHISIFYDKTSFNTYLLS